MKTALITGASRGIGAAIARRLSDDGFRVILNCRQSRDACVALARELGAYAIFADISREDEVAKMAEEAEALGGVDVLVNNAGIAMQKMLCDTAPADWDGIFAADMRGAYFVTRALMGHMVHNKYGRIINISSIWGEEGASCEVAYSAAKAALIGFTKSLAKELAPSGICVNCIAPGVIDTEMNAFLGEDTLAELAADIPLGRLGDPREVASAVSFFASQRAGYITGQVLGVNGGMHM